MWRGPCRLLAAWSSAGIEVVQALLTGLGRSCDTNDWLSNSIGAVIGAGLGWAALAVRRREAAPVR
ncbi:VanZ family protein [Cellulomonas timonensis]|uniref:VanZ family protein n=1 Tax=Cellulomonas timonensis TaxID=1689271 RepID=UPI0036F1E0F2